MLTYYRYSYDLTNTLQKNLTVADQRRKWNTRFMWNYYLLAPAFNLEEPRGRSRWVLPLIHGFVDQASKSEDRPSMASLMDDRDQRLYSDRVHHLDSAKI